MSFCGGALPLRLGYGHHRSTLWWAGHFSSTELTEWRSTPTVELSGGVHRLAATAD
jgi:hypothetical protein